MDKIEHTMSTDKAISIIKAMAMLTPVDLVNVSAALRKAIAVMEEYSEIEIEIKKL